MTALSPHDLAISAANARAVVSTTSAGRRSHLVTRLAAVAFESLLNAIDANDPETGAHVRRVAACAVILACRGCARGEPPACRPVLAEIASAKRLDRAGPIAAPRGCARSDPRGQASRRQDMPEVEFRWHATTVD